MKKLAFLIIAVICLHSIFGQKKELAVLQPRVIGNGTVSVNDQLNISSSMKKAFAQVGYDAFTRTEQSLISAEQTFQLNGIVDEKSIKEVGKQTGVAYICVLTLAKDKNEFVVSSEINNVAAGKIVNSDYVVLNDISNRENVDKQCQELVCNLLEISISKPTSNSTNSSAKKEVVLKKEIIWAEKNVGASNPEDYGSYLTWEQAKTACPKGWRLPTKEEFESLIKAGSVFATQNGKYGRKFGDSNNSIFFPAAGQRNEGGGTLSHEGAYGYYWSSTVGSICQYTGNTTAYRLKFFGKYVSVESYYRSTRFSVRCVKE